MHNPLYFEQLAGTLQKHLPASYVQRLIGELSDHAEDTVIAGETSSPQQTLGAAEQLADQVVHEFRGRTFAGRHPWFCMLTLPFFGTLLAPLIVVLLWLFTFIVLMPLIGIELVTHEAPTAWGFAFVTFCIHFGALLSFIVLTAVITSVWRRTGRGLKWFVATVTLQILTTALVVCELDLSPEQFHASVNFGTDPIESMAVESAAIRVVGQMMLPLLFAATIVLGQLRDAKSFESDECGTVGSLHMTD